MKLVIDKRAQRQLQEMLANMRAMMLERLKAVAVDPFAHTGTSNHYAANQTHFVFVRVIGVHFTGSIAPRRK